MIGSDLEGADLESRVASCAASAISDDAAAARGDRGLWRPAGGGRCGRRRQPVHRQRSRHAARAPNRRRESAADDHIRRHFRQHAPGLLRSDSTTSPSKATSRQSGQQARGRSRSALPARRNQRVSGSCSFWNARGPLENHAVHVPADAGAVRRGLLRHLASPPPGFGHAPQPLASPSTTRLRLRRHLPARTGAVQVDVGVAGAVRVPALGAPALLAVTAPAYRCTEGEREGRARHLTEAAQSLRRVRLGRDPARIPEMSAGSSSVPGGHREV